MITGQEKPDSGEIVVGPTVKLSYVDQSRDALEGNHNVFQEIAGGLDILNINGIEIQSRAYIGRFNFKGQDQQKMVGSLSGGERGRLHMAKTLLQGGNVLLLDEPSNDLDIETLRALEDALLEFPGNTFVISHDRWFLDRIATHILAFEGDSHVEFFQGNYREYEEDKRAAWATTPPEAPALQGAEVRQGKAALARPFSFCNVYRPCMPASGRHLRATPCPCSSACSSCSSTAPPCAPSCWPVSPPS
jgi:energy-coupling factor transporter ATP-binding protein EcfA2